MADDWFVPQSSAPSDAAVGGAGADDWVVPGAHAAPISTAEDVGRSLLAGTGEGIHNAVSPLTEVAPSTLERATDAILPGAGKYVRMLGFALTPSSFQNISENSGALAQSHTPQTTAGEYARTVGEMLPNAALPTGAASNLGGVAVRSARVLVPALTSETAGQLTKGTEAEPWARVLGAVAGGLVEGGGEAMTGGGKAATKAVDAAPSVDELKDAARKAYKAADTAGAVVKGESFAGMAHELASDVDEEYGIDSMLHPKSTRVVQKMQALADTAAETNDPTGIRIKTIENLRRNANDAALSDDKADANLGRVIRNRIDQYMDGLTPDDVVSGDAPGAVTALHQARGLWRRASQGEMVGDLIERAGIRAGQFSGSGFENALRTEFRRVAMNKGDMSVLSPELQAAMKKVAMGGPMDNWLRYFGRLAPTGAVSQLGEIAMTAANPALGVVPAIGAASRALATAATSKNADLASEIARLGHLPTPAAPNALKDGVSDLVLRSTLPALLSDKPGLLNSAPAQPRNQVMPGQ